MLITLDKLLVVSIIQAVLCFLRRLVGEVLAATFMQPLSPHFVVLPARVPDEAVLSTATLGSKQFRGGVPECTPDGDIVPHHTRYSLACAVCEALHPAVQNYKAFKARTWPA